MPGQAVFFPLTAIQCVAFVIFATCLAVRGLIMAPEYEQRFKSLLVCYGIYAVVFLWPVVNYDWMMLSSMFGGGTQTAYDLFYHTIGTLLGFAILIVAIKTANRTGTKWKWLFPKIYFSCWGYQALVAALWLFDFGVTFLGIDVVIIMLRVLYVIYALMQVVIPVLVARRVRAHREELIAKRRALMNGPTWMKPTVVANAYYTDDTI